MATHANLAELEGLVSLHIAGQAHELWDSYDIDSDLMVPADAWYFGLGLPTGPMPAAVAAGATAEVWIGGNQVLTGRIDRRTRSTARPQRGLSISGRDGAAVLVDCSAPIFSAREISLAEVMASIARPLGVTRTRIDSDAVGGAAEKVAIDPGIKAWDALQQAAEASGLWPWFEPDGTLVVGGPDYSAAPVATLIERFDGKGNNVLSLSDEDAITDRYSEISLLGQAHGVGGDDGKNSVMAQVRDASVPYYRPLVVVEGDLPDRETAQTKARKLLMDGRLAGLSLTAVVRGHRTSDGVLWTPGQRVHVQSDSLGIDGIWFVMGRRFQGGRRRERVTELRLKEDGVWVLDAFKKNRKTRKGKKLTPVVIDVS